MSNAQYHTRSGHRRVEVISLDGQPTFRVSDAYGYLAGIVSSQAYVPIRTRQGDDGQTVLSPVTVAGLRTAGVELADLDI